MSCRIAFIQAHMPPPITVAIVEDDKRVRDGLAFLIGSSAGFQCVGTYPYAEAALKQIPWNWPDVVLMDINLPEMSGIDCVGRLKQMNPKLHVIMLTAYANDGQIFQSLKRGASGYLLKKSAPAKILEAITDVLSGGAPMSNLIARKVIQHFQELEEVPDQMEALTPRENELLDYLVKGYRNKEIADLLGVGLETIRTHLRNIYQKLHVTSRTEAVVKYLGETGIRSHESGVRKSKGANHA